MTKILKLSFIILGFFAVTQCAKKEFGKRTEIQNVTSVRVLKQYPQNYMNSYIKINGLVVDQSSRGLWINVQDKHWTISVNFEEQDFSIPSVLSNKVTAVGKFVQTSDGYLIKGCYLKIEK